MKSLLHSHTAGQYRLIFDFQCRPQLMAWMYLSIVPQSLLATPDLPPQAQSFPGLVQGQKPCRDRGRFPPRPFPEDYTGRFLLCWDKSGPSIVLAGPRMEGASVRGDTQQQLCSTSRQGIHL